MRYHFSGVAGAGMAPLACLMRARGHEVQGSDRALDQGKSPAVAARLRAAGITLVPQDGAAVTPAIDRFVYSAAVEAATPEMIAARRHGVASVARPRLLAEILDAGRPGIAIAGTSGKSTITGLVLWVVREAGVPATVIGGAALVGEETAAGFLAGPADGPVVAEACESDGTLVGYRPAIGVIHNVSRDHGELPELRAQFATFAAGARRLLVNARCGEALAIGRAHRGVAYGAVPDADVPLDVLALGADRAIGTLRWAGGALKLDVPQPGLHNLENAAAAALVALELGLDPGAIEALLPHFPGVARRFEIVGTTRAGIRVVDDYAHNGEKLRAAITTAQARGGRVLALFQPHGFGPARFLRPELRALLPTLLRANDRFCYLEIFYAGGTVTRDVSSRMLAADIGCAYAADHAAAREWVTRVARPGDTVLVMGARDPDLPRLARDIFAALG
jgi:UDP-N-acetylmuramate--alanine ligase